MGISKEWSIKSRAKIYIRRYLILCFLFAIVITSTRNNIWAQTYNEDNLVEQGLGVKSEEVFIPSDVEGPVFSKSAGFYTEEFELIISTKEQKCQILYTLDGSVPSLSNPLAKRYNKPLIIGEKAMRESSSSYFCGTLIRAVVVLDNGNTSDIYTNTYFVHPNIYEKYKLPIISLTIEPHNLYDYEVGLFNNIEGRGREWEKQTNFEFFTTKGTRVVSQSIGARLHGGASREFPFKSFRLYAREEYDTNKKFEYDFFSDSLITATTKNGTITNITSFKRLILRNGGNEGDAWDATMFRDILIQSTMANTVLDIQAYLPTVVFLNGEFYGIMNLIERQDEKYISSHYNTEEENIAIYDFWYNQNGEQQVVMATGGDDNIEYYNNMITFMKNNDLAIEENYRKVVEWIDVDNYIDYLIVQIYTGNTDWPGNNCRAWRTTNEYNKDAPYGLDGRLRWLLFDTDFGFGLYDSPVTKDSLSQALAIGGKDWPNQDGSTFIFRNLIKNEEFKNSFITRFLDLVNTNFSEKEINNKIDVLLPLYSSCMNEFKNRYYKIGDWEYNVEMLRNYVSKRMNTARFMLNGYFKLGKYYHLNINMQDDKGNHIKGSIGVNSILIHRDSPAIDVGIWSGVYYDKLPTNIEAYPAEGYKFLHWIDGDNNILSTDIKYVINDVSAAFITVSLQPVFVKESLLPFLDNKNDNNKETNDNLNDEILMASGEDVTVKKSYYELVGILIVTIVAFCLTYYFISKKRKHN